VEKRIPTLVAAGLLLLAHTSSGDIITVPGDYPTIQAGVAGAADGDTVLVAPGTYCGAENREIAFDGKVLHLVSQAGPTLTIIDCESSGRAFYLVDEPPGSTVEGFTIAGGSGTPNCHPGGAVYVSGMTPTSISFTDCAFSGNHTCGHGGALATAYGVHVMLHDCGFVGNSSGGSGGAIYMYRGTVTSTDCVFQGNWAGGGGGALYLLDNAQGSFSSAVFQQNAAATGPGGAVYLQLNGGEAELQDCYLYLNEAVSGGAIGCEWQSQLSLNDCTLYGNSAVDRGGAIYLERIGCFASIHGCVLESNTAGDGGAVCQGYDSSAGIQNSAFIANTATSDGGAIHCLGDLWLQWSTFVGNTSAGQGGAFLLDYGHSRLIRGSTIVGNSALVGGGVFCADGALELDRVIVAFSGSGGSMNPDAPPGVVLTCCDLFGNPGGDWIGSFSTQLGLAGNISEDPLFCGIANADQPWTLHADSPCAPDANPDCGLLGAWDVGCGTTGTSATTWGQIKTMFR
jgi:predicted outer membrane repeat protein